MKKVLLITLLTLAFITPSLAEQLRIELKSGNTIVVNYSGNIQGVTFDGQTDSIKRLTTHQNTQRSATQSVQPPPAIAPLIGNLLKTHKGGKDKLPIKIKWANPEIED